MYELHDADTAELLRPATFAEAVASARQADRDGGAGIILITDDGEDLHRAYVPGDVDLTITDRISIRFDLDDDGDPEAILRVGDEDHSLGWCEGGWTPTTATGPWTGTPVTEVVPGDRFLAGAAQALVTLHEAAEVWRSGETGDAEHYVRVGPVCMTACSNAYYDTIICDSEADAAELFATWVQATKDTIAELARAEQ